MAQYIGTLTLCNCWQTRSSPCMKYSSDLHACACRGLSHDKSILPVLAAGSRGPVVPHHLTSKDHSHCTDKVLT
jgi:hypothetical protein